VQWACSSRVVVPPAFQVMVTHACYVLRVPAAGTVQVALIGWSGDNFVKLLPGTVSKICHRHHNCYMPLRCVAPDQDVAIAVRMQVFEKEKSEFRKVARVS